MPVRSGGGEKETSLANSAYDYNLAYKLAKERASDLSQNLRKGRKGVRLERGEIVESFDLLYRLRKIAEGFFSGLQPDIFRGLDTDFSMSGVLVLLMAVGTT